MRNIKKYGIFAALAALLLFALIIGCSDSFSAPKNNGYTPPAGYGAVVVQFRDANARTILPITTISDFEAFELIFTPISGAGFDLDPGAKTFTVLYANRNDPINLLPGTYDLDVTAFMDAAATLDAAIGSRTNITIAAGVVNSEIVNLRPESPATASGQGTFSWDITLAATAPFAFTVADMDVSPITPGPSVLEEDLLVNPDDSEDLNVGYYYVIFDLADNASVTSLPLIQPNNTLTWRQVLYIYKNLISPFSYTFSEAHFRNPIFTVTFDFNYTHNPPDDPLVGPLPVTVLEGTTVSSLDADAMRPNRTPAHRYFIGWTENATASYAGGQRLADLFDFTTQIYDNLTLYAWWEESGHFIEDGQWVFDLGVNALTFTEERDGDGTITQVPASGIITVSRAAVSEIVITADDTGFSGFVWQWDGTNYSTTNVLTVDLDVAPFNINATYLISVVAQQTGGGPVSADIQLVITN